MLKKNKICLSAELLEQFFTRIAQNQVGNLTYINIDLFRIAISRLEQVVELEALNKKNTFTVASQDAKGTILLDEIMNLQEDTYSNILIIQNIVIDLKAIFEELLQNFNKTVKYASCSSVVIDQISVGIEETFKKLKDIEIYNKKMENFNNSKTSKLTKFREKFQLMENYLDNEENSKKVLNATIIDHSASLHEKKADKEYISKLLKDIAILEENQESLESDYEHLKKADKDKESRIFKLIEDHNDDIKEIENQRCEIENLNTKINSLRDENDALLKKTYKDIENREAKKRNSKFKMNTKSASLSNFDHLLNSTQSEFNRDDIKERYTKLKKYATDIEKQKKVIENTNKDYEEKIYQQKKVIYDMNNEIRSLKLQINKVTSMEVKRASNKDIKKLIGSGNVQLSNQQSVPVRKESSKSNISDHEALTQRKEDMTSPRESGKKKENTEGTKSKQIVIEEINIQEEDEEKEEKAIIKEEVQKVENETQNHISPTKLSNVKHSFSKSIIPTLNRNLMEIAEDEEEPEYFTTEVENENKKRLTAFDSIKDVGDRKFNKITTVDIETAQTEMIKKLNHHRSRSTMSFAKTQSVFLMLNNEDADSYNEEKSILQIKLLKEEEEKKLADEKKNMNFDFTEITSYDFLYKKSDLYLKKLFDCEKQGDIFSDNIFIYDSSMTRSKNYYDLIVTSKNIYLLEAGKEKLKSIFRLVNLFRITVSNKNFNLLVNFEVNQRSYILPKETILS